MTDSIDPALLYGGGAVFAALLVIMLLGMWRSGRALRAYNRDVRARLASLRIARMLDRLGIGRERFLHKNSPLNVERRLHACATCSDLDTCDRYLAGEALDERTFCPNYPALIALAKPGRQAAAAPADASRATAAERAARINVAGSG